MKLMKSLFAATAIVALAAGAAQGKQLVYCSEASPAHFDPGPLTGGNDFDATSHAIYNRLVEFVPGGTEVAPALAESWEISEDGLEITFKLRPGVKWHTTPYFTPTRDFNAEDVVFSFEPWKRSIRSRSATASSRQPTRPPSPSAKRFFVGKKEKAQASPRVPVVIQSPSAVRCRAPIACAASSTTATP